MSEIKEKLTRAEKMAGTGKVSRREFVQLAMAAGMTAAAAETLFVKSVRAQPKAGGSLKLGIGAGATTDRLDPGTYTASFRGTGGSGSLGNSLTEMTAKGDVVPDLAESVEPADDAKTWVYKLRKGLTFHNGKDVTADDVIATYRFHMGEDSKSAAKSITAGIADIKSDGPGTVIFSLSAGNADFPFYTSDYHLPIMPAKDGSVDWQSGIRTGPFVLDKFEPGVNARMKKNANYHKSGQPYVDELEVLCIPDVAARTAALTSGEIQYMDRCDLKTLGLLQQNPEVAINEVTGYGHYVLPMNTTVAPFDDVNVRLAL